MRKLVTLLGAVAITASVAVPAAALTPRASEPAQGQFFGGDKRQQSDKPACRELAELRRELARLKEELRHLYVALAQAWRAGNRERAVQITHEIRRVQAEIEHVQHQIRRLLQECRDR
jgi:hypothetical protein